MKGKVSDKAAEYLASLPDSRYPVVSICEAPAYQNGVLIERIEDLLAQAKSGELVGLAWVCQWKGDKVSNGWQLSEMHARKLIGEIEFLKRDILDQVE